VTAKRMTQHESLMEWRNLAGQEKARADELAELLAVAIEAKEDAEGMVMTLRADLGRAEAENHYWRDNRWWARLLWWRRP